MTGTMINLLAQELAQKADYSASAHFVTQQYAFSSGRKKTYSHFTWEPDQKIQDPHAGYEIRISDSALTEMLAWIEKSRRLLGPNVETGGLLFGEREDASRVVWVNEVMGPPPDSEQSEEGFICGIKDIDVANGEKRKRSRGAIQYIGMWHTHPNSAPLPSLKDLEGMKKIVSATDRPARMSLLLIIGTPLDLGTISSFIFRESDFLKQENNFRECSVKIVQPKSKPRRIGLALSGGGSRAIAFQLGCLRTLHDRGLLEQIQVISGVSGGSVIAALYAYSNNSFSEFETKVITLLRNGLLKGIVHRAIFSPLLLKSIATFAVSGVISIGADILRFLLSTGFDVIGKHKRGKMNWVDRIQPPLPRWTNRTKALENTLRDTLYGDLKLTEKCRRDIEIVLNACELRTGSAFRFGSRESGCWRFGRIVNDVSVAHAVAASAAYPLLLPAIDRSFSFVGRDGKEFTDRVLLTDGGVFDNLGVTCMEPGHSSDFSYNAFHPEYIICCNAGRGLFSELTYPSWWVTRMVRSFESIFRKAQDSGYERMHHYVDSGELKGFILSYLGQQDGRLPYIPSDLIRRDEVWNYPTDFSSMSIEDIDLISTRGEQLTRILIARYTPEL